ncbi:YigZ family protein [Dialister micraerophilus]|uniref:YigZ family protein n=1 Tax=Dialister micraerophilus TaxID=309120 RepID=UPI00255003FE|nr:YigZ family protein [Dialister micraerophilus]MDK8284873.1 YigZ family protein [Dialister micraerophilus]
MLTAYESIEKLTKQNTEIKKSLFIAQIAPVNSEKEAQDFILSVKKNMRDATHNCSAYRIGIKQIAERSSDDGEPQGTAGHPMLHVLQANNLTNVVATVTRYFGGIKLGAGGLTRAYSSSLANALNDSKIIRFTPHQKIILTVNYTFVGAFENYIKDTDIIVTDRLFTDKVKISMLCLTENSDKHIEFFTNMTSGTAIIETPSEEYVKLPL